jgi:hypothetical protein
LTHGRKRQTLSTKAQTDGNEERGEEKWVPHKIWNSILWHYSKSIRRKDPEEEKERVREREREKEKKGIEKVRRRAYDGNGWLF